MAPAATILGVIAAGLALTTMLILDDSENELDDIDGTSSSESPAENLDPPEPTRQ